MIAERRDSRLLSDLDLVLIIVAKICQFPKKLSVNNYINITEYFVF